ncbi:MAG: Lrp/AsnC family transcriptional regulator [Candidatus Bathyarchaeia archaeon]
MKAYMGLTCKPGAYNEVLKKLLFSLNIDQQNVFLLFGPVDILVRFQNLTTVEEFIEKWVNPIRMIGANEDLITKTMSLIVAAEGPVCSEKPFAFLFLNTKPQNVEDVRTKLLRIPEVLSADSVLGPYDVICSVKAEDYDDLETSVLLIQQIDGLESSITSVVSPIKVLPDW